MKKIAIINSNTLPGTAGYIRCEKVCVETTRCFDLYDSVKIDRELNEDNEMCICFWCNEMTSSVSSVNVCNNVENNHNEIIQSSVYYSIIKYAGLDCKKCNLSVFNDSVVSTSDGPSILIKVKYSCEETGFELLAEDIARGCTSAIAESFGLELKKEYINNCFYVKQEWNNVNTVKEKFFSYESALYRAKITSSNLYDYEGKCLVSFYGCEKNKRRRKKR